MLDQIDEMWDAYEQRLEMLLQTLEILSQPNGENEWIERTTQESPILSENKQSKICELYPSTS
jgi:hypothetical protein